tara:strand:+ start:3969 stop:4163 length:195 start_codon:yes stop_codon:yes gene_type:complete
MKPHIVVFTLASFLFLIGVLDFPFPASLDRLFVALSGLIIAVLVLYISQEKDLNEHKDSHEMDR